MSIENLINSITECLVAQGYQVEWPVTGKLLLDGNEIDVDYVLQQAKDAWEAVEYILNAQVGGDQ